MTSNSNNEKVINVIKTSEFYNQFIDKLYYIPQKDEVEDIEVFYTIKSDATFSYNDVNDFSDLVNSSINYKGQNGYFFVYLNLLDAADEDVMNEFESKRNEVVEV